MISDNTKSILMLCTKTGLSDNPGLLPYSLSEWNKLARKIAASEFETPMNLLGITVDNLMAGLDLTVEEAERIGQLLNRGTSLAIELDRLQNLGIWVLSRADPEYPEKHKRLLKESAPPILFGAGEKTLLNTSGIAIVGSRDIDEDGKTFAENIGNIAAYHGLVVISGGARGVDITAMKNALEGRGQAVGILANSLEQAIKKSDYRNGILRGDLTLFCPYGSNIGFNVGIAMGRNKLIYTMSDYAVVVSSDFNEGGTWTGAIEALKNKWGPVFIRNSNGVPVGNKELIRRGGIPISDPLPVQNIAFLEWLNSQQVTWQNRNHHPVGASLPVQPKLFVD